MPSSITTHFGIPLVNFPTFENNKRPSTGTSPTGALRKAVREELSSHPLVDRRESDGDDGATIAYLD